MTITKEIITDLMPLYLSGECSRDTKALIEEFFRGNPNFAEQIKKISAVTLPGRAFPPPAQDEELKILRRTRKLLRIRSYALGFAIVFTLAPFSFVYTNGHWYFLFLESPWSALVYVLMGIDCWVVYGISRRKTRDL
jgi:hypothetical protein